MAICWERAVPLAFHLCCFYFSAVLAVGVPFRLVFWAGCGIRLYRFLIIAFLSTFSVKHDDHFFKMHDINVCLEVDKTGQKKKKR